MKILSGILKDLFDNLCLVDFLWWERTSLFNREQFLNVNDFSLLWEQSRCQTRFKKQPNNRTVNQASELGWTTLNSETEFPILLLVDRVYRNKHTQSHRITEQFRLEGTSGGYLVHPSALVGTCWTSCPGLASHVAFEDFQRGDSTSLGYSYQFSPPYLEVLPDFQLEPPLFLVHICRLCFSVI